MQVKRFFLEGLELISVKNHDNFNVTFCPLGASITSIELDDKFLTLTPYSIDTFKEKKIYHGKTIGRVSNRIPGGKFKIKNKEYHTQLNDGTNTLHGGDEGFSNQIFDVEVVSQQDETKIIFSYLSIDTEAGFPGNLRVKVIYTVFENANAVTVDYNVHTDKDTMIGLTNHSYFHLGSPFSELSLYINANKFIHPDRNTLAPTDYRPVNEVMDFQVMKKINQDIEDDYLDDSWTYGYDHHYCFNEVNPLKAQVVLENNSYKLEIYTNFNGTQIYTDNYPDQIRYESVSAIRRRAVAIEPQDDLLNRQILQADDTYIRFIRYNFIRK